MLLICRNVALVATMFLVANVFGQGIPEDRYADEADRAKSLLRKAVDHYQENGEKAIAAFSRQGQFIDDELYVYVIDTEGIMLASGGPSANLIGRDVSQALNDDLNKGFKEALALPPTIVGRTGRMAAKSASESFSNALVTRFFRWAITCLVQAREKRKRCSIMSWRR